MQSNIKSYVMLSLLIIIGLVTSQFNIREQEENLGFPIEGPPMIDEPIELEPIVEILPPPRPFPPFPGPFPRPYPDEPEKEPVNSLQEFYEQEVYDLKDDESINFKMAPHGYALITDKAVYKPGETIRGQIYFYDKYTKSPKNISKDLLNSNPKVTLLNGNDQEVAVVKNFRNSNEVMTFEYAIDNEQPGGFYRLEFKNVEQGLIQRQTIFILGFKVPTEMLLVSLNKDVVNFSDKVMAEVNFKVLNRVLLPNQLTNLPVEGYLVNTFGQKVWTESKNTDSNGNSIFEFEIPNDDKWARSFTFVAHIMFQGRKISASRELKVFSLDEVMISFNPASGKYVKGMQNQIYFEAFTSYDKKGEFVIENADLVREDNKTKERSVIKTIKSELNGKGKFSFYLDENSTFYLILTKQNKTREFYIRNGNDKFNTSDVLMKVNKNIFRQNGKLKLNLKKKTGILVESMWLVIQDKTRILLEKEVKMGNTNVDIKSLNFLQGGILTVQLFRKQNFGETDQEMLIYVHPKKKLKLSATANKDKYAPGDIVVLNVKANRDALYGVVVTDESSFLQIDSKKLPPSLPTKVFLENEFRFDSKEFPNSSKYIDWFFMNGGEKLSKEQIKKNEKELDLLMGNQSWRNQLLAGDRLKDLSESGDNLSDYQGSHEYLIATKASDLKQKFNPIIFERMEMRAFAAPMAMQMADGGMMFDEAKSITTSVQQTIEIEESPQNENTLTQEEKEQIMRDDTLLYASIGVNLTNNSLMFKLPAERTGTFRVSLIGVNNKGQYGLFTSSITVEKPFNATLQYPDYIRDSDKLGLDLILENNTSSTKLVRIDKFNYSTRINANSTKVIPLTMTTEVMPFEFIVKDVMGGDTVPIFVDPLVFKGFAFNKAKTFIIKKEDGEILTNKPSIAIQEEIIDDDVIVEVTYQPMNEAVFLKGLDKLIREPHGCFEQTSSTTFPMVLLGQYLEQLEDSDKVAKMKLDIDKNLRKGIKRLLGFETPTGGFEWFGSSPGHVTLTAYGIWQFLEMNKLDPSYIDNDVIDRALNWLKNQYNAQDKEFKVGNGLDALGNPPQTVSDVYVLFVLTMMKDYDIDYDQIIAPVLEKYEKEVFDEKDSYLLAFVGMIYLNLNMKDKLPELINLILSNQDNETGEFTSVKTSITQSRGKSLKVEATALVIILLQNVDFFQYMTPIEKAINFLQENMEEGYFGSTQATILGLKAIAENMKLVNSSSRDEMQFSINVNGQEQIMNVVKAKEDESKTVFNLKLSKGENINTDIQSLDDMETGEKHVFNIAYKYRSRDLENVDDSPLELTASKTRFNNLDKYSFTLKNNLSDDQGMVILMINKPSYSKVNLDDLEMLRTSGSVDFYELRNKNSEIIFYWRGIEKNGQIDLDFSLLDEFRLLNADPVAVQAYLYYDKEGTMVYESLE